MRFAGSTIICSEKRTIDNFLNANDNCTEGYTELRPG
jgi:hypothetical protein